MIETGRILRQCRQADRPMDRWRDRTAAQGPCFLAVARTAEKVFPDGGGLNRIGEDSPPKGQWEVRR